MELCDYGCQEPAKFKFKNGKNCCSSSANKCSAKRNKDSQTKRGKTWQGKIHPRKNKIPWNKGLTKETDIRVLTQINKLKKNLAEGKTTPSFLGKTHSKETKKKMSNSIKKRYDSGWMPKAGRCKKYKYKSPIAGEVSLDGTWELGVAKYLDLKKIEWRRNTKKFKYKYKQKNRTYTPDFYLVNENTYLEIKGYKTDLDEAKWKCFSEKLQIWYKKELKEKNII